MDDPENSNPEAIPTGEPDASAADSNAPGYVTAADLAAFQKEMQTTLRKTVAGMFKTQPAPPQAAKSTSAPEAPPADLKAQMDAYRTTERAIARSGLNDDQSDMLRTLIDASQPDDVASFIAEKAKLMGPAATGTPTPEPQTKAAPNPNPTSDRGAPGMTASLESDDVPVWKWSQDKVDRFIKEKGYREFANVMKKRLPKDLQGVRFHIPRN